MITVVSRPQGHKLTEQELSGSVSNSGGQALVTTLFAHGLVDGQYIYVQSNIESYNGFKVVDSTAYNSFTIGDYKQDATILYRISVLDHGWQCVHLPIVYELESDLYPTNTVEEVYTPNTVVSQSNNQGYTQINLSSALRDPTELSWVKIGMEVYQIITVLQPWSVVINLAYDAANTFGPVVRYYKNYCININIYAGLPAGHRWEAEKPYELAATLQLIPDENNQIKFSVNEILRGYINVRNNLTLDTLPNNLDFMVAFKIGYFESYDETDGQEITTFEGSETVDDFEGYAVNAKLPFKEGSFLSDYINEDTYLARWLTIQEHPIAIVGRFFDLSFLLIYSGVDVQIKENGIVVQTIVNPGLGVIRVPLEFTEAGEKCIQAVTGGTAGQDGVTTAFELPVLSTWVSAGGAGAAWTPGSAPIVNLIGAGIGSPASAEYLIVDVAFVAGYTYRAGFTYTKTYNSGSSNPRNITLAALDSSNNVIFSQVEASPTSASDGFGFVILEFVATSQTTRLGITCTDGSDVNIQIDKLGLQHLENNNFDDATVWTQTGSGPVWTVGSGTADVAIITSDSQILVQEFTGGVAGDYEFSYQRITTNVGGGESMSFGVTFYDEAGALIGAASYVEFISGNNNILFTHPFTTVVPVAKIQILIVWGSGANMNLSLLYARLVGPNTQSTPSVPAVPAQDLTEELCVQVLEECDNTLITADGIRLLEDGDFRLLE